MSFSRANPPGWAFGEILTSTQMNTVDLNQSRAVDGNAGGTYTPSGAIIINGSGIDALVVDRPTFVSSATFTRWQALTPVGEASGGGVYEVPGNWSFDFTNLYWEVTDSTTGNSGILIPFSDTPAGSSLTVARFFVRGAGFTALPSAMPTAEIDYLNDVGVIQNPTPQAVADGSADTSAFATPHNITVTLSTPLSIDPDATGRTIYGRLFYSSSGSTGGSRNFQLLRLEADFNCTVLNP